MKHRGLRHLHLVVPDLDRSVRFYEQAFGMKVLHRRPEIRTATGSRSDRAQTALRRLRTAAASSTRSGAVVSQSMQASVMLWP